MAKRLWGTLCAVFLLIGISACGLLSPEESAETVNYLDTSVSASINSLPGSLDSDHVKLISMPGRQQYCYQSVDGNSRMVLEVQAKNQDTISTDEKTDVKVGRSTGVSYLYSDGEISLYGVNENDMGHLLTPENGERVLEWSDQDLDFRLYGMFTEDELLTSAESVEVTKG